jgi:hypothetical protein
MGSLIHPDGLHVHVSGFKVLPTGQRIWQTGFATHLHPTEGGILAVSKCVKVLPSLHFSIMH